MQSRYFLTCIEVHVYVVIFVWKGIAFCFLFSFFKDSLTCAQSSEEKVILLFKKSKLRLEKSVSSPRLPPPNLLL